MRVESSTTVFNGFLPLGVVGDQRDASPSVEAAHAFKKQCSAVVNDDCTQVA